MARSKSFVESEVLDKALNLFWTKGYNATSIQDLVDHLGINRASIYSTWGDKHGLYLETLKQLPQRQFKTNCYKSLDLKSQPATSFAIFSKKWSLAHRMRK